LKLRLTRSLQLVDKLIQTYTDTLMFHPHLRHIVRPRVWR